MILLGSTNANIGFPTGMEILRSGGSALDAVEATIRPVEDNPADRTVGFNGYPNILGDLELDASLMDGRTLESGAVGAMKGVIPAISVARKVMETLPHVLLVGDGADRFAKEMGFESAAELLTPEVIAARETILRQDMSAEEFEALQDTDNLRQWVRLATDPERTYGTVNVIAQDKDGNIACGVSTSGWAWKYPGRLGDSPIIGAGNYADNRYGAAACTGMGEMAIRASTARSIVLYMKMGLTLADACAQAMQDLNELGGSFIGRMNLVALDKDGTPAGYSSMKGKTFIYQTDAMADYVEQERTLVEIEERWG